MYTSKGLYIKTYADYCVRMTQVGGIGRKHPPKRDVCLLAPENPSNDRREQRGNLFVISVGSKAFQIKRDAPAKCLSALSG